MGSSSGGLTQAADRDETNSGFRNEESVVDIDDTIIACVDRNSAYPSGHNGRTPDASNRARFNVGKAGKIFSCERNVRRSTGI